MTQITTQMYQDKSNFEEIQKKEQEEGKKIVLSDIKAKKLWDENRK